MTTSWLQRMLRGEPKYHLTIVGIRSGKRYPETHGRFYSREEGEAWIRSAPPLLNPPLTRWELIER